MMFQSDTPHTKAAIREPDSNIEGLFLPKPLIVDSYTAWGGGPWLLCRVCRRQAGLRDEPLGPEVPRSQPSGKICSDGHTVDNLDERLATLGPLLLCCFLGAMIYRIIRSNSTAVVWDLLADIELLDGTLAQSPVVPKTVLTLPIATAAAVVGSAFESGRAGMGIDPSPAAAVSPQQVPPRGIVQLALARRAVAETRDAQGAWEDETGVVELAPQLGVSRKGVEAAGDGRSAEQVRQREQRENADEQLVREGREEVVVQSMPRLLALVC